LGLSELGTTLVARLGLFESDLTLLMPVRVTRAKNIEFALRVTQALKAQVDTLRLMITGPPDPHSVDSLAYFGHLKALRQELGVENEVRFVFESGPSGDPLIIGPEEVGELYRVCDLAFIPSLREGFGMPIIEASLSGIPILSTDIPAVEEVGREHMMVFSVTDLPEQVASRIVAWLHSCPQHQLRRRVRQNFTWDTVFRTEIEPLLVS
jgi:glycosyltransferase involved in cell wall biosynthesis